MLNSCNKVYILNTYMTQPQSWGTQGEKWKVYLLPMQELNSTASKYEALSKLVQEIFSESDISKQCLIMKSLAEALWCTQTVFLSKQQSLADGEDAQTIKVPGVNTLLYRSITIMTVSPEKFSGVCIMFIRRRTESNFLILFSMLYIAVEQLQLEVFKGGKNITSFFS